MKKKVADKNELVTIKVKRGISQKIKMLASLETQTMQEWLEWMVNKAHEAKNINNRPHLSRRSVSP